MRTRVSLFIVTFVLTSATFLLNGCAQNQDYTKWELPEGAKIRLGKGAITGNIAYSPDGNRLAVASSIGIWMYDAHTSKELDLFIGHRSSIESVCFSPDGSLLASGSLDRNLCLWNAISGKHLQTFTGHTGVVFSVSFSSDGSMLASGGGDDTVRLWDAATG